MAKALSRRTFLAATGLAWPMARTLAAAAEPSSLRPCDPSAWQKHGPVLEASPAAGNIQNFTSPAEPLADDRWRLWYSVSGTGTPFNVAWAEGAPGKAMTHQVAELSEGEPADAPFAIGNLPRDWRPVQVVHLQLASGKHRIYFWAHGPKVVRYLAAESDDGRRYRVLDPHRPCLYHPADRAVSGEALAEIGLKRMAKKASTRPEGEPAASVKLLSNDATNVYQLPDGRFEMYSVGLVEVAKNDPRYMAHDNAAGWIRVIDRYASEDGLNWTDRRRVLVPDASDPVDQQFYYLAVTYTPQGRVGMLGHYRVEAQTMDIEWCFSKDGIQWERPVRGPWIPRGQPGEPDSYGVYASHNLVFRDSRWHLFYSGVNFAHNHKHSHGEPRRVVLWASCPSIWQ
jgi:hypothetical protein